MNAYLVLGIGARALVACAFFAIVGCAPGNVERRWSEEVVLDDGKVISIGREVEFKESNSWAGDAYSSTILKSTIEFQGDLGTVPVWSSTLTPLVIFHDTASAEWVVVAASSRCEEWSARGKPLPPYWEYRLRNGKWDEVPLSGGSIGKQTNLFLLFEKPLPARRLSAVEKAQIHSSTPIGKKSLSILSAVDSNYCK